jgi:hypothetical protein
MVAANEEKPQFHKPAEAPANFDGAVVYFNGDWTIRKRDVHGRASIVLSPPQLEPFFELVAAHIDRKRTTRLKS